MENVSVIGFELKSKIEVTEYVAIKMVDGKSTGGFTSNCIL
jgi:hypothetical protein